MGDAITFSLLECDLSQHPIPLTPFSTADLSKLHPSLLSRCEAGRERAYLNLCQSAASGMEITPPYARPGEQHSLGGIVYLLRMDGWYHVVTQVTLPVLVLLGESTHHMHTYVVSILGHVQSLQNTTSSLRIHGITDPVKSLVVRSFLMCKPKVCVFLMCHTPEAVCMCTGVCSFMRVY